MAPPAFPFEIHSMIIRFATHTPVFFDLSPDPQFWPVDDKLSGCIAADYATKKALTRVSRQFRYLSLPILYQVVKVHKGSNMHLLADVLDVTSSRTATPRQNPRKIEYLFVSLGTMKTSDQRVIFAVFNSLGRVLTRCGRLRGFGLYDTSPYRLSTPCYWWRAIPDGVRFVDWHGTIMACDFAQMIDRVSESLISLRFSKFLHKNTSPHVSLPKLTHLSIVEGFGDVLENWSAQSLTHLSLNVRCTWPKSNRTHVDFNNPQGFTES
ncbi:hypothetical protein BD410DRAFT_447555 [Rickenella mellea]|uniref:F-box domain-containing protein n=1 Tax=Rickenella mellea TaxID=50990 RepID=A0A4Y7PUU9_9AGAM|nr:hypothetical protein BD410DRAFT_447555 [Rickenella mellea]